MITIIYSRFVIIDNSDDKESRVGMERKKLSRESFLSQQEVFFSLSAWQSSWSEWKKVGNIAPLEVIMWKIYKPFTIVVEAAAASSDQFSIENSSTWTRKSLQHMFHWIPLWSRRRSVCTCHMSFMSIGMCVIVSGWKEFLLSLFPGNWLFTRALKLPHHDDIRTH